MVSSIVDASCIYTVLMGEYEDLNDQPALKNSKIQKICFTDNLSLRSEDWEVRYINPIFPADSVRSQRAIKIQPHVYIPEYDRSLYIDNSVILKNSPDDLFNLLGEGVDLLAFEHSFRETLFDEFIEVVTLGLDDQYRVFEQLNHLQLTFPNLLTERPIWTGILLRRHTSDRAKLFSNYWYANVLRYSRRDQLSINFAINQSKLIKRIEKIDNNDSQFHYWPVSSNRKIYVREKSRDFTSHIAPLSDVPLNIRIERLNNLVLEGKDALDERDTRITHLESSLYERDTRITHLESSLDERDTRITHLENCFRDKTKDINDLSNANHALCREIKALQNTKTFRYSYPLRRIRAALSTLQSAFDKKINFFKNEGGYTNKKKVNFLYGNAGINKKLFIDNKSYSKKQHQNFVLSDSVDCIVCVHNALEDVRRCLDSLVRYRSKKCNIVIVDDGSDEETKIYLEEFTALNKAQLLRNNTAKGYTFAANQGIRSSSSKFVVLLNSDTVVTPGWLEKMIMCAESSDDIGLVGPLSNTASWQSIPKIEEEGDWAKNSLPQGISIEDMGELVAKYSQKLYPQMSFLNGFCLLIRRKVIEEIGVFDEDSFGRGYGEENDYCIRAKKYGWKLALADDAYVFHAQSKSYSHEKRKLLSELAGAELVKKHGENIINYGVEQCRNDLRLIAIRARASNFIQREEIIKNSKELYEGKSILFVLPIVYPGGGGNVVISEAMALNRMGVNVSILNKLDHKPIFEKSYPKLDLPVIYVDSESEIHDVALNFDAVVATANHSVAWIASLRNAENPPILGYYIQDFEPNFYPINSIGYEQAFRSYGLVQGIRLFTKSTWNRDMVLSRTGYDSKIIGPSVDVDLFSPKHKYFNKNKVPIHIVSMVRPSSPRRNPEGTIQILSMLKERYGDQIDISIFGAESDGPPIPKSDYLELFTNYGVLDQIKVANLLSKADIFIDMSHYQAMGLTGMEAMLSGAAVVLPMAGGASEFATDDVNAFLVDTLDVGEVFARVSSLIENKNRLYEMQSASISCLANYFPERAASLMLDALFSGL